MLRKLTLVMICAALPAAAQMMGHGMHGHGADGTGHDEVTMPGLRGLDATPEESRDLETMFRNFSAIDRSVELLPDGIRATTTSSDPEVLAVVMRHVSEMLARVEDGRDPQVFIQSPTLDILFERNDAIETEVEVTDTGIIVIQTSDDPEVAEALKVHAGEVSDMAARGMQAVHERMMQQNVSN